MAGISKTLDTAVFNGQGYIIVFDEVADYTSATVASITANGFDVGQVFEGSSSWTGDEPSFEDKKDEQGDTIVPVATKGTFGFDFSMADYSAEKMKTFMGAEEVNLTAGGIAAAGKAVKVGAKMPVITRPIAWVNEDGNKTHFFPKARILTGVAEDGKLFLLKSSVKAMDIDTTNLGTYMLIDKLNLTFNESAGE